MAHCNQFVAYILDENYNFILDSFIQIKLRAQYFRKTEYGRQKKICIR